MAKELTLDLGPPARLSAAEIETILAEPSGRDVQPLEAENALRSARTLFENRALSKGGRYLCLRAFQNYLACRKTFTQAQDDEHYVRVLDELREEVKKTYENGLFYERSRRWPEACQTWEQFHLLLPENDPDSPISRKLLKNIVDHLSYARGKIQKPKSF